MPHQCTSCDRLLPSGSREMLGGCPDCGGNRFQYLPGEGDDAAERPEPETAGDGSRSRAAESNASGNGGELIIASGSDAGGSPSDRSRDRPESAAQADARSSVIDPADLPASAPPAPAPDPDDRSAPEPAAPAPVAELTEELEDTFGSIRIVERGEYELNLLELYENDACIIQLEEDGRYVIDVPDMFKGRTARE